MGLSIEERAIVLAMAVHVNALGELVHALLKGEPAPGQPPAGCPKGHPADRAQRLGRSGQVMCRDCGEQWMEAQSGDSEAS